MLRFTYHHLIIANYHHHQRQVVLVLKTSCSVHMPYTHFAECFATAAEQHQRKRQNQQQQYLKSLYIREKTYVHEKGPKENQLPLAITIHTRMYKRTVCV